MDNRRQQKPPLHGDDLVDKSASQTFLDFEGWTVKRGGYTYEAFNTLIDRTSQFLLDLGVRQGIRSQSTSATR